MTSESERLAAIVDSAADAIIGASLDGTITTWNRSAEALYGHPAQTALGRHIGLIVPDSHRDELDAMLATDIERHLRTIHVDAEGREVHLSLVISPIRDSGGATIGSSVIARDMSEQADTEVRLRLAVEEAEQEMKQFAYAASHDLQEPLRMVSSYTELLAERYGEQLDEKAERYIEHAQDGARRMRALIEDLLVYSRIRTRGGKLVPTIATHSLERAMKSLGASIRETEARVVHHLDEISVIADQTQLVQVFRNLISNSIKFRRGKPEVTIGAQREGRDVVFSVRDEGIGVDPEHFDRIFQMFERLHTRSAYPGTGIGLALCKRIIDRHGGRLWVESDGATGSTFRFTLNAAS